MLPLLPALILLASAFVPPLKASTLSENETTRPVQPNIVFILTDDHRWDCFNAGSNPQTHTPHLDRIAKRGTRFENAFVTLAICSPSRAACLTGRYGSANGVTSIGKTPLKKGETTFAHALKDAGYATGAVGKWHLKTTPTECGFDFASTCWSNGTWYDRKFTIDGKTKVMPGFVDDIAADEALRFIQQSNRAKKPFALWLCTQVPHMDDKHAWPAKQKYLDQFDASEMPQPQSWNDNLTNKPEYLKTSRNRTQAIKYGYQNPSRIQEHAREYYASVTQMDAAVGRVLDEVDLLGLTENTWIIFMGDNGWFLGEHGMTSKVLPYEESMRVPMAIAGPKTKQAVSKELVLNIDLTSTIFELAGLETPQKLHGKSLLPIVFGNGSKDWRTNFLYEAPTSQLGSQPLWAVRNERWKYVETVVGSESDEIFPELYDLKSDAIEKNNLALDSKHKDTLRELAKELRSHREAISKGESGLIKTASNDPTQETSKSVVVSAQDKPPQQTNPKIPTAPSKQARTDIHISGVYPHLTTYGVYSQNGAHNKSGHNECGIGAVVPWAGKLWMVNYAPHQPRGSEHKLFSIAPDLNQPMTVHPESVGGTPAGRMIHTESNQLLIAHHFIDNKGKVRTISPKDMPIRVTAIARHLRDPANMVYYIDMEGSIWEANVHTLAVKRLFKKPVPGWHSKGGYTSQGRLVISNNGELHVGDYKHVLVGGKAKTPDDRGVLAEYDGTTWKIVERRQFTEVTGPKGITGGSDGDDPIWTMGWDRRSVRLKVLDNGKWHTYLLPKAAYCNDASHGWYTEWPRIREITDGRWMMDMHGMFFEFPNTFSSTNSGGIKPIGSHLRYVPDFCDWNGKLILATDETSIQGNPLAGQPQSNLWFGSYDDLKNWGPASGYGGPWIEDTVSANTPSDPFLVAGFDRRILHLAIGQKKPIAQQVLRTTDQIKITHLPSELHKLQRVSIPRGNWRTPTTGFEFEVDRPVTVFLAIDGRSDAKLPEPWKATKLSLQWGKKFEDRIFSREFLAGKINIPADENKHSDNAYCIPPLAFVQATEIGNAQELQISPAGDATVTQPSSSPTADPTSNPVSITLQVDRIGNGQWTDLETVELANNGYLAKILPEDLEAVWLRLSTNRDCVATAIFHQTTRRYVDGNASSNKQLFAGLADVGENGALAAVVYPAKRNRDLRVITGDDHYFDFTKAGFEFKKDDPDPKLKDLLHIEPEFTVDEASIILKHNGQNLRLPKGNAAFDRPFASGWPRASREVESERHLANIHGTFYEIPLVTNGSPPAWNLMRPVSSHSKQIADFCSWNGLLVLTGVRRDAKNDVHVFHDAEHSTALWFGGIDDLWKLGKPIGRGGPWLNSNVKKGIPSDPYLMKGYDQKSVKLSHSSTQNVNITLQVDLDGTGLWVDFRNISVPPNAVKQFKFPNEFSACWVRGVTGQDTKATLMFEYQ